MTVGSSLVLIQKSMTRYVLPITLGLGNVGNLILLYMFIQLKYRNSSCSLYFLAASVFSIVGSNWAVVPLIYSADHADPLANSLILCRARGYIIHACAMSFRTMIVLAAADRYVLSSSRNSIRAFSSIIIARKLVILVPLFWLTVSVHLLIWVSIENGRCFVYGLYGQIYSMYQLICFGIIPTVLMILFSILTVTNIRYIRSQVAPIISHQHTNPNFAIFRKRDIHLFKLVISEIIVSFICTFPYTINTIYSVLTSDITNKSIERLQIESFCVFFTMWFLLYLKYSTTFYTYAATSKIFRTEVKVLFKKICITIKTIGRNL
ncbi:hypothetical protein I4U23_023544 [Adineta vaga]|nr:hypothetical protein I4U23_023544 [Adineta vaga]